MKHKYLFILMVTLICNTSNTMPVFDGLVLFAQIVWTEVSKLVDNEETSTPRFVQPDTPRNSPRTALNPKLTLPSRSQTNSPVPQNITSRPIQSEQDLTEIFSQEKTVRPLGAETAQHWDDTELDNPWDVINEDKKNK